MPAQLQTYRAKPVTIEAVQHTADNTKDLKAILGSPGYEEKPWDPVNIHIRNEHRIVVLEVGDWLIKGSRGEFYPCKDSTFQQKYELAQPQEARPPLNPISATGSIPRTATEEQAARKPMPPQTPRK